MNKNTKWKYIKSFEGRYSVSKQGFVKSHLTDKIMRGVIVGSVTKYLSIVLRKDGRYHRFYIHRLIAQTFVENPGNKPFVNHIDGNKLNNNYKNLEWVTDAENRAHSNYKIKILSKREYVPFEMARKLYTKRISYDGKSFYIGRFKTKEECTKKFIEEFQNVFGFKPRIKKVEV
jgi:hypothetical protein